MPRPYLGELAYQAYVSSFPYRAPPWDALSTSVRLAWGRAAHAAVVAAHEVPCPNQIEIATEATVQAQARRKVKRSLNAA